MTDLLARIAKLHDMAGKFGKDYNPAPIPTHTRPAPTLSLDALASLPKPMPTPSRFAMDLTRNLEKIYDNLSHHLAEEKASNGHISKELGKL